METESGGRDVQGAAGQVNSVSEEHFVEGSMCEAGRRSLLWRGSMCRVGAACEAWWEWHAPRWTTTKAMLAFTHRAFPFFFPPLYGGQSHREVEAAETAETAETSRQLKRLKRRGSRHPTRARHTGSSARVMSDVASSCRRQVGLACMGHGLHDGLVTPRASRWGLGECLRECLGVCVRVVVELPSQGPQGVWGQRRTRASAPSFAQGVDGPP